VDEHAEVVLSDPHALENARLDLGAYADHVIFEADAYKAAEGAHAICVLTEWEQYTRLDFERIYHAMVKPAFIFDGRNILDHARLHKLGFNVYGIGKPPRTHFANGVDDNE
jgi:UDPglucose 6-dehydrogenase